MPIFELPKPLNYRLHLFRLFGNPMLTIAGMAGPHNNSNPEDALRYLIANDRQVLIGLHEEEDFSKEAERLGLEYHYLYTPDYLGSSTETIEPELFLKVYKIVKEASLQHKQVAIHCGSGNGRTGAALASLKLCEILEQIIHINPSILDEKIKLSTKISTMYSGDVPCTPMVKVTIDMLRRQRHPAAEDAGALSVESLADVNSLIKYEAYLKGFLKAQLSEEKKLGNTQASSGVLNRH